MLLYNPCRCMDVQLAVKVVAGVEAVIHFLFMAITLWAFLFLSHNAAAGGESFDLGEQVITIIIMFLYLFGFEADIGLFFGAKNKNATFCWTWMGYTGFLKIAITTNLVFTYLDIITSVVVLGAVDLLFIIVEIYFAYVVYFFIKTLRQVDPQQINAEMGGATPSGAQLQPAASAAAQGSASQAAQLLAEIQKEILIV